MNKANEAFNKAGSFDSDIGTFSGFTPIDILSANIEHANDLDIDFLNGGMFDMPYTEIGLSASGKTTLWIQVIGGCIDNWRKWYGPVSDFLFYNVEMHTTPDRIKKLTGWDDQTLAETVHMVTKPWSIIEIYNDIAKYAKQKLEHRKELEVDTGIRNILGSTIKCLPTTYVLIDSIAAVRSKTELEYDKDGNVKSTDSLAGTSNMDAMQIAKDNTLFINEVKKLCADAKICIVMINHLVEIPVLDRYNPPKPQLPGMKFNQKVKGGTELLYQSYCVGQLSIRERMFDEKKQVYGPSVHGIVALMDWLKNKNGPEGVRYPMVFDGDTGYKPELTDFEILYSEGCYGIKGSPLNYHLSILPEISFTRKTLLEKCHENPLLARALSFTTRLYLISKVINRETPPDISDIETADFDARVKLILTHSCDYPGYVNHGWVVPEEYQIIADNYNMSTNRVEGPNIKLKDEDLQMFMISNGNLLDTQHVISSGNESIKIGETEFTISNGEHVTSWKK
jgi:hypothetical protein